MTNPTTNGPLTGVRVLDVSTVYAGPLACQLLGDFGADVIKIEHPRLGDPMRTHGRVKDGQGLWWKMVARNKRTIGLYLGDPDGAEVFCDLVRRSDIVVENFRPGTLDRWGVGYDRLKQVNPDVVLVRVTGFGQEGPYAARPAFGTLAEAMSGFAAMTGQADGPPTLPPFGLADGIAGISAAYAAILALYHRDARGGSGQQVDLAILEPLLTVLGPQPTTYDQLGEVPQRHGNRSENNAPRNTYRTRDGRWVAVSASTTVVAARVMELVGAAEFVDEPWFASGAERARHADLIDGRVAAWVAERGLAEVAEAFEKADAPIAVVYDVADLMADPQVRAREMITSVDDPDLGPLRMQNLLFRMADTPGAIRHTGRAIGADTDAVLAEAGVDPARVAALRERGVVA
ncbi:CaiB/BaiF CoA transferase family protein [Micromonospora carbonacea]|uniref:Crotonobetainyl-CoA:carnitine CoA-transferase CaiB n=1 Tax=Micromonospora carbonacea TaxID=47853 RepID=A0A1C4V992_9ACTN|nr:CoA transferase [Micromonospora carbonacea]SCE80325.1 Crotonobetainyl-CoA:carnitine CoA-transferase CaiB [Micromonospora carbonacea]